MYHQRKYWTVNRDLFQEVIDIVFSQMFQKRCRIASWDNYLIHDKWKNSKNQHLSHSFVSDASLNLIKKGLWFILCYILKFNNKLIFDYQNIHLPYGSIWKTLNLKEHRNGYNKIIGRLWSIVAPELNERLQGKVQNIFIELAQSLDQRKTPGYTVKCQANFLAHLL